MLWLLDTNIFLRLLTRADPSYSAARDAIRILLRRGAVLSYTLQSLTEFWSVCTRPATARGGLGLAPTDAEQRMRLIERRFTFLPDTLDVRDHWRRLVVVHSVSGVAVHDARLVASLLAHGGGHLLTFDADDFRRYPEVTAADPREVTAGRV